MARRGQYHYILRWNPFYDDFMRDSESLTNRNAGFEWPTWLLLGLVYLVWIILTLNWSQIPLGLLWILGGYTLTLHSSLQHEAIHGHPTSNQAINLALVYPPLLLWLPLALYNRSHQLHHACDLTHPVNDPESFFVSSGQWNTTGPVRRWIIVAHNTFAGRLLLGPILATIKTWSEEIDRFRRGDSSGLGIWIRHLLSVTAILAWVTLYCDMPLWVYLLCFAYPGTSLILVRSFLEHRYDDNPDHRTVVVEGCPVTRLLFLNNNFHSLHHRHPGLAWYRIPRLYRSQPDTALQSNGGYFYPGYWTIAARYLFRPWTHPVHPGTDS